MTKLQFLNNKIYRYTKKIYLALGNLTKLMFWSILFHVIQEPRANCLNKCRPPVCCILKVQSMARHKILHYVFMHSNSKNKRSEEKRIKLHKEKQQKICSRKMTVNLQKEKSRKLECHSVFCPSQRD